MGDKLAPLPEGPYIVIISDCPWTFEVWSAKGKGRSAEQHYPCLTDAELAMLPVAQIADRDCALCLWIVSSNLLSGLKVMEAWGFTFKTVLFVWAKQTPSGEKWNFGHGYYTRAQTEICLLGTKGHPKVQSHAVPQLIVAPRREHSRKPDEQYKRIERLFGNVPRIELFARQRVSGWDAWGLDVDPNIPAIW